MCIPELSPKVLSSFMIIKRKTLKFKSRVRIVFENPAIRSGPLSKLSTVISEGKVGASLVGRCSVFLKPHFSVSLAAAAAFRCPVFWARGDTCMTSAIFSDFCPLPPSYHVQNSRNLISFVCFLGTPSLRTSYKNAPPGQIHAQRAGAGGPHKRRRGADHFAF